MIIATVYIILKDFVGNDCAHISPILRIGDQVPTFDVFWPKHLQEVRSTVLKYTRSVSVTDMLTHVHLHYNFFQGKAVPCKWLKRLIIE